MTTSTFARGRAPPSNLSAALPLLLLLLGVLLSPAAAARSLLDDDGDKNLHAATRPLPQHVGELNTAATARGAPGAVARPRVATPSNIATARFDLHPGARATSAPRPGASRVAPQATRAAARPVPPEWPDPENPVSPVHPLAATLANIPGTSGDSVLHGDDWENNFNAAGFVDFSLNDPDPQFMDTAGLLIFSSFCLPPSSSCSFVGVGFPFLSYHPRRWVRETVHRRFHHVDCCLGFPGIPWNIFPVQSSPLGIYFHELFPIRYQPILSILQCVSSVVLSVPLGGDSAKPRRMRSERTERERETRQRV